MIPALSLAIVGTQFPNQRGPTRRFELEICRAGEDVELRPEPKNPADENAIAIYSCRGVQLGYVASARAALLIGYLKSGATVRAIFQGVGLTGGWVRVTFDGSEPAIPSIADGMASQPKPPDDTADSWFWRDPVYDD